MIYIYLADGFEESEALLPFYIFKHEGVRVKTVSITKKLSVKSSRGKSVKADLTVESEDYTPSSVRLIILPGGEAAAARLAASPEIHNALKLAYENGKRIAAFSDASSVLDKIDFQKPENPADTKKVISVKGVKKIADFVYATIKRIRYEQIEEITRRQSSLPTPPPPKSDYECICIAMEGVFKLGRVNTGYVQRCLHVGFNKAFEVIDALEKNGFVSQRDEVTHQRKILIDHEEFEKWKQENKE